MSTILRWRARRMEEKIDSLGADHTSLLQASIHISEVLDELENVTNRLAAGQRDGAGEKAAAALLNRLDYLPNELSHILNELDHIRDRWNGAIEALLGALETKWRSLSEDLRVQLGVQLLESSRLVSDHLALHVVSSASGARNPEVALMNDLYGFLPAGTAVDVGAHRGDISQQLLDSGYQVYAFEPAAQTFEELRQRLGQRQGCYLYNLAVGAVDTTMPLLLAEDVSVDHKYGDASLFNSLVAHSMPVDLRFVRSVNTPVRSLKSLAREQKIPTDIGLLKVDTEGFDLQVLRGLQDLRPHLVAAEFWAPDFVFGQEEAYNRLDELVKEMRSRDYRWHIVMYRIPGEERISFYCNYNKPLSNSWGNVLFFRDHELFVRSAEWCSAILPKTYFDFEDSTQPLVLAHRGAALSKPRAEIDKLKEQLSLCERQVSVIGERANGLQELLATRNSEFTARERETERELNNAKGQSERQTERIEQQTVHIEEQTEHIEEQTEHIEEQTEHIEHRGANGAHRGANGAHRGTDGHRGASAASGAQHQAVLVLEIDCSATGSTPFRHQVRPLL